MGCRRPVVAILARYQRGQTRFAAASRARRGNCGSRGLLAHVLIVFLGAVRPSDLLGQYNLGPARWRLAASPTVRLDDDGTRERQFTRIVGATRLPSGNLVVADGPARELRVFAPNGRFLRSLARPGSGPGELERLDWFTRLGDTLAAGGFANRRVTVFDSAGAFSYARAIDVSGAADPMHPEVPTVPGAVAMGRMADGRLLLFTRRAVPVQPPTHIFRDTVRVGIQLAAAAGTEVQWLGQFGNRSSLASFVNGEFRMTRHPLLPQLLWAISDNAVWLMQSDGTDIVRVRRDGSQRRVQLPAMSSPLTEEVLQLWRDQEVTRAADARMAAVAAEMFNRRWLPRLAPNVTEIVAGFGGEVWLSLFPSDPSSPKAYLIVDSTGTVAAQAQGPSNVRFLEIGLDYALGVATNADGVESIVQYQLIRSPSNARK